MTGRPHESEYPPLFAAYVALVQETDVMAALTEQAAIVDRLASGVSTERERHAYGPGKWTVREVIGHLGDGERVFGYRATGISRGDQTRFPAFDENLWVANARFDASTVRALADELLDLRRANLAMLRRLDEPGWARIGIASDKPISVRALAYIMAGHVRHHLAILAERYGVS